MAETPTRYIVTDGRLVLTLEAAEEGGYVVTAPFDPGLVTEADSLEEAFEMARDAAEALRQGRATLPERPAPKATKRSPRRAKTG